jgi:polysaccharide biosynthesis protein PslG
MNRLFTLLGLGFVIVIVVGGLSSAGISAQGATPTTFIGSVIGGNTPNPPNVAATVPPTNTPQATPELATPEVTQEPTQEPTPSLPTLTSDLMGVQIYAHMQEQLWWGLVDRSQFMGFKWIKFQLSWKEVEPNAKGEFAPKFEDLRKNLVYAGQRGFKVLISIANAPDWARPEAARGQLNGPPANPAELAEFVGRTLDFFGTQYVSAIEIWNEPNLQREWNGATISGAVYQDYFEPAYQMVRSRSADIIVVSAGPAPTGDTPASMNDRTWLRQLYDAGLPTADPNFAIGIHPYGWANAPDARCCADPSQGWDNDPSFFFLDTIYAYRDIMVEKGHASGKMWATEFGWSSFDNLHYADHVNGAPAIGPDSPDLAWMNRLDQNQQAEYVIRAFELAQSGDLATFMGPMFLWNLNFATLPGSIAEDGRAIPEAGFSILDNDWATREIYLRLQAAPKR